MKYRDPKTGEVFEDIGTARACICKCHACDDCSLDHPTVAARLMGLEVVV